MTPTEKLAMAVPVMRESLMMWCGHLNAVHIVGADEHAPSPALDEVLKHVAEMHTKVKEMCGLYDNLRSLVGTLEHEQGVKKPIFHADHEAGCVKKSHCPNLSGSTNGE